MSGSISISKRALMLLVMLSAMLVSVGVAQAATLSCSLASSSSVTIDQFSSENVQVQCSASGGTVSGISITASPSPTSGLSISSSDPMLSSLTDSQSDTATWSITGNTPSSYTLSFVITADSSVSGSPQASITVSNPAQLQVSYIGAPSTSPEPPGTYSLDVQVKNLGASAASNVILKYNSASQVTLPSSIPPSGTTTYSWTLVRHTSDVTATTRAYIGSTLHDSVTESISGYGSSSSSSQSQSQSSQDQGLVAGGGGRGSGRSSSVGGGGIPFQIAVSRSVEKKDVVAGEPIDFTVGHPRIAAQSIQLTTTTNEEAVNFEVASLKEAPPLGAVFDPESVYQYMEISPDVPPASVDSAKVGFRVTRNWMKDSNLEPSEVALYQWEKDRWNELNTYITVEKPSFVDYEADVPHFSFFAIGKKGEILISETPAEGESESESDDDGGLSEITGNVVSETDGNPETQTAIANVADQVVDTIGDTLDAVNPTQNKWFNYVIAVVVVVVVVLIAVPSKRKFDQANNQVTAPGSAGSSGGLSGVPNVPAPDSSPGEAAGPTPESPPGRPCPIGDLNDQGVYDKAKSALTAQILDQINNNADPEAIRNGLISQGWPEDFVDEVINSL